MDVFIWMCLIAFAGYFVGFAVASAYYANHMRSLAADDVLNATGLAWYWPETVLEWAFGN